MVMYEVLIFLKFLLIFNKVNIILLLNKFEPFIIYNFQFSNDQSINYPKSFIQKQNQKNFLEYLNLKNIIKYIHLNRDLT